MELSLFISRNIQSVPRACAILLIGIALASFTGCGLLQKCGCSPAPETHVAINRVDTVWQQEVCFAPNTQNGKQVPGILGRVWLYSPADKNPVDLLGTIEASLVDITPAESGGQAVTLAYYRFNPRELEQLKRKDLLGMGYSLFLPLESYRPDIKQVRIQLVFVDGQGNRTDAPPDILTLRVDQRMVRMQTEQKKVVPAAVK